ncbi:MAG: 50S ribosomal protein L21 [Candidatus Scalindua arabica]|uniref:Large ribosomal subunit protein bL21 n=1 Tax=Candidatus Scalindua arabica TaxID=1127984 RepID=A0A941W4Y6_9BACT|nr:50S ribosomal protein L21 [Candidatus Scalindua arabica]
MYAVIKEGGKQYKVEPGKSIEIDLKGNVKKGDTLELKDVLMVSKEGKTQIGTPTVENAKVISEVQNHTKGRKLVVMKFRRRKDSRTKQGHRQKHTKIKIKEIVS